MLSFTLIVITEIDDDIVSEYCMLTGSILSHKDLVKSPGRNATLIIKIIGR